MLDRLARVVSDFKVYDAHGPPGMVPLIVVPGFGTLRVACTAWNDWETFWEPATAAPTYVTSTEPAVNTKRFRGRRQRPLHGRQGRRDVAGDPPRRPAG